MMLHLQHLLLLGLLGAALHWIVARSQIAKPFWSRLTGWPAKLLACPACSGFWIGLGLRGAGLTPVDADGAFAGHASAVVEGLTAGMLAVFLTPVFQAVMLWGLHYSAVPVDEPVPEPVDVDNDMSAPPPTSPMSP